MDARLVTVAREISSLNANIIRSRLEAEGIQCFVSGEKVSSVVGLPANVGAFIDVQVLDFDAARAQSILQEIEEAARDESEYEIAGAEGSETESDFFSSALFYAALSLFNGIVVGAISQNWFTGIFAVIVTFCVAMVLRFFKNVFPQK
jgi:hypothetical protein